MALQNLQQYGCQANPNNPVVILRFSILPIVPIEGAVLFELLPNLNNTAPSIGTFAGRGLERS